MFVFSKGKPKTFNPLKQLKSEGTLKRHKDKDPSIGGERQKDGTLKKQNNNAYKRKTEANKNDLRIKSNVWDIQTGNMKSTKDKIAFKHPAIFPEQLANDHILSWSNECDIVYDCFAGSGTTAKMSILNNRNWIASEMSTEYCDIIKERIKNI
jgi:DNA modification methylase